MSECLALVIPLLAIGFALQWVTAWPLAALIGLIYLSEWIVWALAATGRLPEWLEGRRYTLAEARGLQSEFDRRPILIGHFILFLIATALLLRSISSGGLFVLIVGFCQAQVLAHEMSHARGLRPLAAILYGVVGGTEGYLNHLRHHHAFYSTPRDALNRFFDEPFYGLGRRIRFQWDNARRLEGRRLRLGYALQAATVGMAFVLGGGKAVAAYGVAVIVTRFFIEAFSVLTHYRLLRDENAPIAAWEVRGLNLFDYFGGYHITRHPAHHAKGNLPAVLIAGTPQLPAFLSLLTLTWLAPPLLRRILDGQLRHLSLILHPLSE